MHAARALGMSERQIVAKVEWPLALPLVISGLRSASVQVVATATVAAYSGGGGLGRLLITGNATGNYPEMFAGALLVAVLAMVLDVLLGGSDGSLAVGSAREASQSVRGSNPNSTSLDSGVRS